MLRFILFIFIGSMMVSGCSKDDDPGTTADTLTGKIRGVDFTFGSARYGSISDEKYRVIVFNDGPTLIEPCDANTDDIYLDFNPEKTTDKIDMNPTGFSTGPNTISFHHPDHFQNIVVDREGYYQITETTDTTLTIKMDVNFSDDNYMKGTFIATKCF